MSDLTGRTALVVGGSRGLGRGVTAALAAGGADVVAVARDVTPLAGTGVRAVAADATDPGSAPRLLAAHRPDLVVLVAGVVPPTAPLHRHTWESFSAPWQHDVRLVFGWLGAVLRDPPAPAARVIVFGSAAELRGSPLSGGYAGAKATLRLITGYARDEGAGSGLTFTTVLPALAPGTAVGRSAVEAYAARQGIDPETFAARVADPLTPGIAGTAVVELATTPAGDLAPAYLLTGAGLRVIPAGRPATPGSAVRAG
jgi:NAD(P)-dependent dehydrogenase (short-subunit alcohol dehydrogenase family)